MTRSRTTTGIDLYRTLERRADADERKRLFYVATTRAADYLILSSSLAGYDANELESDWMKLLAERFDLATGELRGDAARRLSRRRKSASPTAIPRPISNRIGASRGPDLVAIVEEARDLAAERRRHHSARRRPDRSRRHRPPAVLRLAALGQTRPPRRRAKLE